MFSENDIELPLSIDDQFTETQPIVLVVDDDASNIQILLSMLEKNYQILVANSGEQALKLLDKTVQIDLVLLDIDMPFLSGFQVLKRLRANPLHSSIPVIMVTGKNHEDIEAYALEQGANDFISKPISAPIVKARIKTQLSLSEYNHTIVNKNIELELSFSNLEKAKEDLSYFMAMVSHELRTPITILQCETELLSDGIRKPTQENLTSLLDEVKHVSALINDMFDLVVSETGELTYEKEPCDLVQLINYSIKLVQPQFQEHNLSLSFNSMGSSACYIEADTKRIRQVIDNLLRNSLKYTANMGKVIITLEKQHDHICIRVDDSEPGVSSHNIPLLFNRFFRVEKSRNRAMGGSGLGLSICKTIIEAHNGTINAGPSPFGGLTLKICLPSAPELSNSTKKH
jgi:signal transduction histidine kinase